MKSKTEPDNFQPNVNVDSGLEALDVPRLDRASEVLPETVVESVSQREVEHTKQLLILCDFIIRNGLGERFLNECS